MKKIVFPIIALLLLAGCANQTPASTTTTPTPKAVSTDGSISINATITPNNSTTTAEPVTSAEPTAKPPETTASSGISGTASIGPTCPVERIPPDPGCADKPYPALLNISQDGKVVNSVQVKADGTFQVALAPGDYVISQGDGKSLPRLGPVNVTVVGGKYASVQLQFDSGIR